MTTISFGKPGHCGRAFLFETFRCFERSIIDPALILRHGIMSVRLGFCAGQVVSVTPVSRKIFGADLAGAEKV
jgi:hypothetical protein